MISLRPITPRDCDLLFEWANDPVTRANSFSSEPIAYETHKQWFEKKLGNSESILMVAVNVAELPVGQVRLDITGKEAVVSISVAPEHRGKGHSIEILKQAEKWVRAKLPDVCQVLAFIKPGNNASVKAFTAAGYSKTNESSGKLQYILKVADSQAHAK